jgi:hypothetical protein
MGALGRFIFWDYPRASWQYDVMVGLILAFIFLTPRNVFRDQPKAASIVMMPERGAYLIESRLLEGVSPEERTSKAAQLVNARYKNHASIVRVEQIMDDEGDVIGYTAFTAP